MSTIPIGSYIFERLRSVGVKQILGVPGDYSMPLLDYIYTTEGLEYIGTCNELNASYAADGLARASGVPAVFSTTWGVGELSAINGLAGAAAESVPVIQLVGSIPRTYKQGHHLVHHSQAPRLGYGDFDLEIYVKTAANFCVAIEELHDLDRAVEQIDRVIGEAIKWSKPATLSIPFDMVSLPVPKSALDKPLDTTLPISPLTDEVVEAIYQAVDKAGTVALLGDLFANRFNMNKYMNEFLDLTKAWGFTTIIGKSCMDETHPQYVGCYNGHLCEEGVWKAVENADLVLNVGPNISDSNSGAFTREIKDEKLIEINRHYARVFGDLKEGVNMEHVFEKLMPKLAVGFKAKTAPLPALNHAPPALEGPITQVTMPYLISEAVQENGFLITETGTAQFSSMSMALKKGTRFFTQLFYQSIGYALPAAFGAGLHDPKQRITLVEGDGSSLLTIQELGSMARHKTPVTVFLINNTGYAIERVLWDEHKNYNDILPNCKWTQMFETFGASPDEVETYSVSTCEEFVKLVNDPAFQKSLKPQLVEVKMAKRDYPANLHAQALLTGERNKIQFKRYSDTHDKL